MENKPNLRIISIVDVKDHEKKQDKLEDSEDDSISKEEYQLCRIEDALSGAISSTGFLIEEASILIQEIGSNEKKEVMQKLIRKWNQVNELFSEYWMGIE